MLSVSQGPLLPGEMSREEARRWELEVFAEHDHIFPIRSRVVVPYWLNAAIKGVLTEGWTEGWTVPLYSPTSWQVSAQRVFLAEQLREISDRDRELILGLREELGAAWMLGSTKAVVALVRARRA